MTRNLIVRSFLTLLVCLLCFDCLTSQLNAQTLRYDLGQLLRRFESQLQKDLSLKQREKALRPMKLAVQSFFSGKLTDAAQQLDDAWVNLLPKHQQDMAKWIASRHIVVPSLLCVDERFTFQLGRRYGDETAAQADYEIVCNVLPWLDGKYSQAKQTTSRFISAEDSFAISIPNEGQFQVRVVLESAEFALPLGEVLVVRASDFEKRVDALKVAAKANKGIWNKSARSTIRQQAIWLSKWLTANDAETNVPALQELTRLELLSKHADKEDWLSQAIVESEASGAASFCGTSMWLSVVGDGRKSARLRVRLPNAIQAADLSKVPCVFAVHGAGGSENMMFDAYGAGRIVELCEQRGWILIAPNIMGIGLDIPDIVDALESQLPIDRDQVFVVGHSMGAGFAMQQVNKAQQRSPRFQFAAVSPIGGGFATRIRTSSDDKPLTTPFFVAAGSDDFGLSGAKSLDRSLKQQSMKSTFKEYELTEHMAIVQIALDDVFEFFDGCVSSK